MKNRTALFGFLVASLMLSTTVMAAGWSGYNDKARIFVGTGYQWCEQKYHWTPTQCDENYLGVYDDEGHLVLTYGNDKITMKWNAAWDTCNAVGDCSGAWTNNEWNGMCAECSGEVWHYKIIWVGPSLEDSPYWKAGGYPIWGEFEVLMDQGTNEAHTWLTHAIPTGYGAA